MITEKSLHILAFLQLVETWDFLTTVAEAEACGQPIDVSIISPGCHINEEIRRVPDGESKSESVYANI